MDSRRTILITGTTGKVGRALIQSFLADPAYSTVEVRALCHQRTLSPAERLEVVK
jgi:UDP-glucose 4-epimerase